MTAVRSMAGLLLPACVLASAVACTHHHASAATLAAAPADSVVGTVSITGTSFDQRIAVRSEGTTTYVAASAADSAALSRLGQVEIVARGRLDGNTIRVANFTARRVEGAPVADGVLRRDGNQVVLETAGGRLVLGNPPAVFRTMIGARVWVSGPLDTGPNSYGVIVPPAR